MAERYGHRAREATGCRDLPDAGRGLAARTRGCRGIAVAKIHYEADGPVSAERFVAALTDFGPRRPELWPGLDSKFYELHGLGESWGGVTEGTDLLGGAWAPARSEWSEPGLGRATVRAAAT